MAGITIRGWIELPAAQSLDGATAIVGLDDVTLIDAPSKRIAETVIAGIRGQHDRIPFSLEVDRDFRTSDSYVLAAEIRRAGAATLRTGDFLSTVAVPWTVDRTNGVVVPVVRV